MAGSAATYMPQSAVFSTSSRPRVALDVDEVLCRTAEAFCMWHSGQPGTDLTECFQRCYSTDASALRDQFLCSDFAIMAEPVLGSQEALQGLKSAGFELHAVTSRPGHCKSSTERFLARCFPALISGLHFASASGPSKGELCRQLGAVALVDDQLQNVMDAASHGVRCVVLDLQGQYVWNHSTSLPNGAQRLYSWAETASFVMSLQGMPMASAASAASHVSQFLPRSQSEFGAGSVPNSQATALPPGEYAQNGYSVPRTQLPPSSPSVPQTQLPSTATAVTAIDRPELLHDVPATHPSAHMATQQLHLPQTAVSLPKTQLPPTQPQGGFSKRTVGEPREVIFKPRLPLGIFVSDLHLGRVSGVFDGQAKEQGLEAYFVMAAIDGKPYSEALLEQKKDGNVPYRVMIRPIPPPNAEVMIECIKVVGQDVSSLPPELRHLDVEVYDEPCFIGRAEQASFFKKLLPDEELRNCISRRHFSLSWASGALQFTRLSVNTIFVNKVFAPVNGTMFLPDEALLYLCSSGDENVAVPGRKQRAACASPLELLSWEDTDEQVPVAVFRVVTLKVDGRPVEETGPGGAAGPGGPTGPPAAPARARLLCTMSHTGHLEMLPASARSFPVQTHTKVGREHQQAFFEAVLSAESVYWTAVSRSHLDLTEVEPGTFLVQNLSVNHVMASGRQLQKGQQTTMQVNSAIDFLAVPPGAPPAAVPQCFLRLELIPDGNAAAPGVPVVPGAAAAAPLGAATIGGAPSSPRAKSFWLELSGTAVLERRRVDANDGKIVVGRAWQFDLHKQALRPEVQTFVSREHFKVEELRHGPAASAFPQKPALWLTALSSNPIWMQRHGQLRQLSKEDSVEVDAGDQILLYTGASDGSPDGSGCAGTVLWTVGRD
ncbi:unnamed protein product [Durusdinium trenchii]|uniref:FHA domain-containing protein n=1 Tax=Durusdinium trenchii TaxID=1381693 RepID=A0ABP0J929_9DINO